MIAKRAHRKPEATSPSHVLGRRTRTQVAFTYVYKRGPFYYTKGVFKGSQET
jgi:hypothetical protein